MYKSETKRVARVAASAVISMALAVGTAGVAFADGSHHGHAPSRHSHEGRHLGILGVVTAIDPATSPMSFTIQGREGKFSASYTVSTSTAFFIDETPTTDASLAVGDRVKIQLSRTTPATVLKVSIQVPSFEGKVLSVTSGTAPVSTVLTISGHEGWATRTVDVTSSTTFVEGGASATLANVMVGSEIKAFGMVAASGVLTATTIRISAPEMFNAGTVTLVTPVNGTTPMTFTVQGPNGGAPVVYTTSATTAFFLGETATPSTSLVAGERVKLLLSATSPQTVVKVVIVVSSVEGTVLNVTPGTAPVSTVLTVTGHEGSLTRTVDVTPSTTFMESGASVTLANVMIGSEIKATGTVDETTGILTASTITISAPEMFNAGAVTLVTQATNTTPMTFTVQGRDGSAPVVYTTSATTTYFLGHMATTSAALVVGDRVRLLLSATSPQTVVRVVINVPSFEGKVLSITPVTGGAGVLSITGNRGGAARTVDVTSSTTYFQGGKVSTVASVVVGSEIRVTGTVNTTTGAINALVIKISGGYSHDRDHR